MNRNGTLVVVGVVFLMLGGAVPAEAQSLVGMQYEGVDHAVSLGFLDDSQFWMHSEDPSLRSGFGCLVGRYILISSRHVKLEARGEAIGMALLLNQGEGLRLTVADLRRTVQLTREKNEDFDDSSLRKFLAGGWMGKQMKGGGSGGREVGFEFGLDGSVRISSGESGKYMLLSLEKMLVFLEREQFVCYYRNTNDGLLLTAADGLDMETYLLKRFQGSVTELDGIFSEKRIMQNESSAIASLRTLSSAQETFRAAVVKDQDGDGLGEYGTLEEMAGTKPVSGSGETVNPPFINKELGSGETRGYKFAVFLGNEGFGMGPEISTNQINASEIHYYVLAWPVSYGNTGKRSFVIDASGVIRGKDNSGEPAGSRQDFAGGSTKWPVIGG